MASNSTSTDGLLAGYDYQNKPSMRRLAFSLSQWRQGARSTTSAHVHGLTNQQIITLEAIRIQETIDEEWRILVERFLNCTRDVGRSRALMEAAHALATHASNIRAPQTPPVTRLLTERPRSSNSSHGVGPKSRNRVLSAAASLQAHADLHDRLRSMPNPPADDLKILTEGLINYEVDKNKTSDGTAMDIRKQVEFSELVESIEAIPVSEVLGKLPGPPPLPPHPPNVPSADETTLPELRRRLSLSSTPEPNNGNANDPSHDQGSTRRGHSITQGLSEVQATRKRTPLRLLVNSNSKDRLASNVSQEDQDRILAMKLQEEYWEETKTKAKTLTGWEAELYKSKPYRNILPKSAEGPFEQVGESSQVSGGSIDYDSLSDEVELRHPLSAQEREDIDVAAAIAESLKMASGHPLRILGKRPSDAPDELLPAAKRSNRTLQQGQTNHEVHANTNYEGVVPKVYASIYGSKQEHSNGSTANTEVDGIKMDIDIMRRSSEAGVEDSHAPPDEGSEEMKNDEDAPFDLDDNHH